MASISLSVAGDDLPEQGNRERDRRERVNNPANECIAAGAEHGNRESCCFYMRGMRKGVGDRRGALLIIKGERKECDARI